MKRNPSALVVLLLLFAVILLRLAYDGSEIGSDQSPGFGSDRQSAAERSVVPGVADARRISPVSWTPPAVFAEVGKPAPGFVFPRGDNSSRRFPATDTRSLTAAPDTREPAVLAMTPEDGRTHLFAEEIDLHTRLARRMVFDPTALEAVLAGETSRVLAPTVNGEVLTLEFHTAKTRSARSHTLLGRVIGEEETSDVLAVYHDGIIHASVARYAVAADQHLEYRILADGHMMVRELDSTTMTAVCGNGPKTEAEALFDGAGDEGFEIIPQEEGDVSEDTAGWRTIDIVVGYDAGARVADGGYPQIEARIIASVDRMSAAFANSAIPDTELMLLGTIEDPDYVFPGAVNGSMSGNDELGDLNDFNDGLLDTVSDFATALGADLVAFITRQADGSAGVGYLPGRASITARDYMTSNRITFAHELGHNLGCDHSWGDSSQDYKTNYGWRLDPPATARVRTIMAYDSGWGSRIPHFANPVVFYNGAATGAVNGYNVLGDATADQRYYQGGLGYGGSSPSDPDKFGFDGNNPALAANNANTINAGSSSDGRYGATYASNRAVRTAFSVTSPLAGAEWLRDTAQTISFNGGDMDDWFEITLFKGGVEVASLASGLNPATHRNFPWTVPLALASGTDYMIRVTLTAPGGGNIRTADSAEFSISGNLPHILSHSPAESPSVVAPVSQVVLNFSAPMNPASFSLADDIVSFTSPTGVSLLPAITGVSWSENDSILSVNFSPQSTPGTHRMIIGPNISDMQGNSMDQDRDDVAGETPDDRYAAEFSIIPPPIYVASMDTDPGWTLGTGWAYGQPTGQGQDQYGAPDPNSGFDGTNVIGYRLDGDYEASLGATRWATTPAIDCSGRENVTLSFQRWLGIEDSQFDRAFLQVSNNGSNWTTVWENPNSTVDDGAWVPVEYDISAVADGQTTVFIRWGIGATDGSWQYCGWNLDNVVVDGDLLPSQGTLAVIPAGGFFPSGLIGGPFAPASEGYVLENTGTVSLTWTAEKTAAWLDLSTTGGTLEPGAQTTVTVSLNAAAGALDVGSYGDSVSFVNTTNGNGDTLRDVSLTVNPIPAVVTLGGTAQTYDGTTKPVSVTIDPPGLAYSVTYDGLPAPPVNAGSYEVIATITEPNHVGGAAGTLVVAKAAQTITFAPIDSVGPNDDPFPLSATASSGLPVSYTSSNPSVASVSEGIVTPVAVGNTTIIVSQAGDGNFDPAPDSLQILSVIAEGQIAIGGEVTYVDGHFIHTFTENGTFEITDGSAVNVEVLVVGGGGGGGSSTQFGTAGAGGGGAGGLIHEEAVLVTGSAGVVVGSPGAAAGSGNTRGGNGGDSEFGALVALGGGGGAGGNVQGLDGGSGGGSRGNANGGAGLQPGSASGGSGNAGGGWTSGGGDGAGGGGGAGQAAPSSPPHNPKVGGPGGEGLAYDIGGSLAYYAGGGGGGGSTTSALGSGGQGGGGNGGNNVTAPTPGAPHTGGGGGGGNNNRTGAAGGSGIVIVRYPASQLPPYESWAAANDLEGTEALRETVLQPDGLTNLQRFAFGLDPSVPYLRPVEFVAGGAITSDGMPTLLNFAAPGLPDDNRAVFMRRKDYSNAGLVYAVEFSAELGLWTASDEIPTVLTDPDSTGDTEVVSVPFPASVPPADGEVPLPPKFFRIGVSEE